MGKTNEFEKELVAVLKKTGTVFGYDHQKVKEDSGGSFYLYQLITHSGVAHTNFVTKEALCNYLRWKAS